MPGPVQAGWAVDSAGGRAGSQGEGGMRIAEVG